jgi:hypothetical protein
MSPTTAELGPTIKLSPLYGRREDGIRVEVKRRPQFRLVDIGLLMAEDPDEGHRLTWFFEFFRGIGDPGVPSFTELIDERPPCTGDVRFDALLVATAEHVAHEHDVSIPAWCADSSKTLKESWNLARWSHARVQAQKNSPVAFAERGIYIEARDLINV